MTTDRWVVLGLAPARTAWFATVAQWANAGTVPIEFVKCLSADELQVRLRSDRPASAVLLDARTPGADRDLLAEISSAGCVAVVVGPPEGDARWADLGARIFLSDPFTPVDLIDTLGPARRVDRVQAAFSDPEADAAAGGAGGTTKAGWHGQLAAVCGSGGTGTSTVAMALAQGLAADPRNGGLVLLADLARHAEQGMLHDAGDVVPGVQELVESHRLGRPPRDEVRRLTFDLPDRGYSLLLGLRRPSAWSAVPPTAFRAGLDSLTRAFRVVICDVDADLEGEAQGGSVDVEDRNAMARTAIGAADVVFAVGVPGVKGMHSLVRTVQELADFGVPPECIQPVVNRAPRSPRGRAELAAALAALLPEGAIATPPVFVPDRPVDLCVRDGRPLPRAVVSPLIDRWHAALSPAAATGAGGRTGLQPGVVERVTPGSLGRWSPDHEVAAGS